MANEHVTVTEVARMAGVARGTISSYKARGHMPKPDGYLGSRAYWKRETIEEWLRDRPGLGWRKGTNDDSE